MESVRFKSALTLLGVVALVGTSASPVFAESEAAPTQFDGANAALDALENLGLVQSEASGETLDRLDAFSVLDPSSGLSIESDRVLTLAPLADLHAEPARDGTALTYAADDSYTLVLTGAGAPANAGYAVLHGETAPTAFSFEVLVDGLDARLEIVEGWVVVRGSGDEIVNLIQPAWAVDATGSPVPTNYTIDGGILTQHVDLVGAEFPVVADPRLMCDALFCTVEYSRAETNSIKNGGAAATALVAGACSLLGSPVAGIICGASSSVIVSLANQARSQGKCLGIRHFHYIASSFHPVIVRCYA